MFAFLAAVNKAVKTGNAATRIAIATDEADQQGEMLSGRQALWIVYDEYRTDSRKNLLYGITHLTALKCEDNCDILKLRNYYNRWNMLLTGLKAP